MFQFSRASRRRAYHTPRSQNVRGMPGRHEPDFSPRHPRAGRTRQINDPATYLSGMPLIIDCLEYRPDLRLLDPINELAYLTLECHRLGGPAIGRSQLRRYRERPGDVPLFGAGSRSSTSRSRERGAARNSSAARWSKPRCGEENPLLPAHPSLPTSDNAPMIWKATPSRWDRL
jgi:hypothetical protein